MNEEVQQAIVNVIAFRKTECLVGETGKSLSQGVKPAFDMVGFPFGFIDHRVFASIKDMLLGLPSVTGLAMKFLITFTIVPILD